MALKFDSSWRFGGGLQGAVPNALINEVSSLIGKIAAQSQTTQDVLELFKARFASAAGSGSSWSSSVDWAWSDLESTMRDAAANAPMFIEAFYDGCQSVGQKGLAVPDAALLNGADGKAQCGISD